MNREPPPSVIAADFLQELTETARRTPPGDFVEVGVYQGGSAARLARVAREQGRRLFLFDTFCGIPFQNPMVDMHKVGDFGDANLESVMAAIPDAVFVVGVFPDSMAEVDGELAAVAFAHVDCDQYESVKACCQTLGPRMVEGGMMVFDDYDVLAGARAAVCEVFGGRVQMSSRGKARVYF